VVVQGMDYMMQVRVRLRSRGGFTLSTRMPIANGWRFPALRPGVLGKVAVALCAVLIALTGLSLLAVRATRDATAGADRIEGEFAERVRTGRAISTSLVNFSIAEVRLRATNPAELRKLDTDLAASDAALARHIRVALDATGDEYNRAEVTKRERIRKAYRRYIATRTQVAGDRTRGEPVESLDAALHRAFERLREDLQRYADAHYREAQGELAGLTDDGNERKLLLGAMLAFGLLSLLAILAVARGIVRRVREYSAFAGKVADGDLTAQLEPRGGDELSGLAGNLNAMVERLLASSRERRESLKSDSDYRASQEAFSEILQVTESEREAHDILKLHIERGVPGSEVVVLNRNNSEDRLEATTDLSADSPLWLPLQSAAPRSCLAVRLARPFEGEGATRSLIECEICGESARDSSCLPLLVSGKVIGSVLVDHNGPLGDRENQRLQASVAQAAPILANLRNLALAEARAATDALTGLPNRRAIQDTVNRMIAQSARTASPMAALVIDLDHFKQVNDAFGHEEGDVVLAAVGDMLSNWVRASDFVGRSGGEEFIALLPDTDIDGALELAEKLRAAIATIKPPHAGRTITASFGVAVHPNMATDAETLLRLADRALYAAKGGGRNRVEVAATDSTPAGIDKGVALGASLN